MKRFSETLRWEEPWYRSLKPRYKCLYEYLWSRCDSAGVWVVDLGLAAAFVGEKMDHKEAITAFSGKVVDLNNGTWLLPEFVKTQCGKLSPSSPPHKRVLECMAGHGLAQNEMNLAYSIGSPPNRLLNSLEEEEEEAEEEAEEEKKRKGGAGGKTKTHTEELSLTVPTPLLVSGFSEVFEQWIPFRMAMKKNPKDWKSMFQGQLDWLSEYPVEQAKEIVKRSIRNGWQGLIEPNNGNQHSNSGTGNGSRSGKPTVAEDRNSRIVGAEATKRAILERHSKPEPKPWDNLLNVPNGTVSP